MAEVAVDGEKILCVACGNVLGVRRGSAVAVKHRGRIIATTAAATLIRCEDCRAIWCDGLLTPAEAEAAWTRLMGEAAP